jgi:GH15 family glucan-1,4-alpha-glucosidase
MTATEGPSHPHIEDYAFLSDMESAALVSRHGSVDWLCMPRFDAAACFCALLHNDGAGRWSIRPREQARDIQRRYMGDTLVLETTFICDGGMVSVVDCLALGEGLSPEGPRAVFPEHVFVRLVTGIEGEVDMQMDYRPRFDYGSITPWFREHHGVAEAVGGPDALDLFSTLHLRVDNAGVRRDFSVRAGEQVPFVLSHYPSHEQAPMADPRKAEAFIQRTQRYWEGWASHCGYDGPWREQVVRSLLTLKGLTYAPSGGIVAAPTASLPEQIGGPRNWDYRYCWLRDATFTLDALLDYGYTGAAREWRDWLLRAVAGDPEDMQIMYGVLGERRLLEYELPLSGYEGSRPVRIGNAAHAQFQLDVYGELMDSFHSARRAGIETPDHAWALEKAIVEHVCDRWREPDEGIWEVRSGPEHFVHSKVMSWVAVDRGIKSIEKFGADGPVERWREIRDEIRADVLANGVDGRLGRFKRSYDSSELDASLLMLPFVGFVRGDQDIMKNTIEAIQRDLMIDGFVHRYLTDRVDDGLPPGEATFLMCSFWLVDCLVLLKRYDEAEALFERLLDTANDLGLLAEQYDAEGRRLLGNFPQAFSHVALVTSAVALRSAGEAPAMRRGEP